MDGSHIFELNLKGPNFFSFQPRMCVPWTVCGIFYTALHWTYEADYVALQKKQEQQLPPDEDEEFLLRPPFWTGGSPC